MGDKVLSVRINEELWGEFTKVTRDERNFSQAGVVEGLIKHFLEQDDEGRHFIVRGVGKDYFNLLTDALQLIAWGDYAYQGYERAARDHPARGSYLPWAIEIFSELDNISSVAAPNPKKQKTLDQKLQGFLGLRRIAWFKLGRAWIALAEGLRSQALADLFKSTIPSSAKATRVKDAKPHDWAELYDAAIFSVRVANANYGLFNRSLRELDKDPHPTVLYNQACTWSLIGQYISEQHSKVTKELLSLAENEYQKEPKSEMKDALQKLPLLPGITEAEDALQKAYKCLSEVSGNYDESSKVMPFADTHWVFDYAQVDDDLEFFRRNKESNFNKWLKKGKKQRSLKESFNNLRSKLPTDVNKYIEEEIRR